MKVKTKSCSIALVSEFLIFLILISSTASASTVQNSSFTNNYTATIPAENHSVTFGQFMDTLSVQPVPEIEWQKSLGGLGDDLATSVCQTSDDCYIVAGYSGSNDGDVTGNHGFYDYWVVKLNANGNIVWQRCFGGSDVDYATSVCQTSDDCYIVAGFSCSNDGDVIGNHGAADYWVVKLDANGNILWQKCLGGSGFDRAFSVQQTFDGGYIVAGESYSNDGDVTGYRESQDYWIVKLDVNGNIVWQKCFGGSMGDCATSVCQTSDGGYVVAGYSDSYNGNVTGNHGGGDSWVVKLDANGNIVWQRCFGGSDFDHATSVCQTSDGGYITAGYSNSNDGNVIGNHGAEDYWIVKLDANGNIMWQKCLGGSGIDRAFSVQQISDGSYVVAGESYSNDGDVTGNHGFYDYWVVKLNANGNIVWQKCFGGSMGDYATSMCQTSDDGYVVAGYNDSNGYNEYTNYFLIKINPNALVSNFSANPISGIAPLKVSFVDQSAESPTSWSWDFGDGNTSTEQNPVHIYSAAGNYPVNLTVSNEKGTDSKSATINVYEKTILPVANFSVNVTEGYAPLSVQFSESSENADTVSWNFGDGTKSTEQNPMHTYSVAGNYTVNLTATNGAGSSDVKSMNIKVNRPPTPPVTNFTVKQTGALTIQFNDTSSNSPNKWNWEFGDGSTSTDANPTHTYAAAKTYAVNLTVSNADGSDAASKKITVTGTTGTPKARFKAVPIFGRAPLTVKFTDNSVNAASIKWDFGDGATSTERNPLHTYTTRGFYTQKFTAVNGDKSSVAKKTIYVAR